MSIKLYEVNPKYIDYLIPYAPHLFQNKQPGQSNERKYIGIVLIVNGMNYFAPLSSFKAKHEKMKNGLDFIKVGNYVYICGYSQSEESAIQEAVNNGIPYYQEITGQN